MSPTGISNAEPGPARAPHAPTASKLWLALGVYILSTLAASVALLAVQPHSGIDAAALSLVQFAPALGALTTWLAFRKTIAQALPPAISARLLSVNLLVTVTACVLFGLLITAAALLTNTTLTGPAPVGGVPFAVFIPLQLIGAVGEEIGWRGLMQPVLESRLTKLTAIAITGTTWALWHVQAFTAGPITALSFFIGVLAFATILGYLSTGTFPQRVLTAAIGHWLINLATCLLAGDNTLDHPQILFTAIAAVLTAAAVTTYHFHRTRRQR
ncbi:CPBP family intramembrane glutamic endopeptidase [Nocardia sp. NPDC058058]|uniref:CPBP family intramembrane glutamic endopeptidase n=1 Tax=Nocardia sp. NPDC058058 TaxID=3346317 RepID=UPI0036DF4659